MLKSLIMLCICFGSFFIVLFIFIFREKLFKFIYLKCKDIFKHIKNRTYEKKFEHYGFRLYCGLGGAGKTLAIIQQLQEFKKDYPKLYICTNFDTPLADKYISSWQDLIDIENPNGTEFGVVFAFDEIHLTFNSTNYKDRPEQLLEYISQQRKMHKLILGSAQVFNRVDKILREQSNIVIDCNTIAGRWNFQRAYRTEDYLLNGDIKDNGIRKRDTLWKKNFIATDKIFNLYDTYQILKPLIQKNEKGVYLLKTSNK